MVKYKINLLDIVFHALADPTRREILARVSEQECCVTELAEPFEMSLPAVSKHLKVLERAQLLKRNKNGRIYRFELNPEPLKEAFELLKDYEIFWEQRLDSLENFLKQQKKENRNKSEEKDDRR